jgi:hypothetical protein
LEVVFFALSVPRLYKEEQLPVRDSNETAVRRVGGLYEMATRKQRNVGELLEAATRHLGEGRD